jgi:hypothetical protein
MSLGEMELNTDGAIVARRNLMLGIWAGMRLGLRGDRLSQYAHDVMQADWTLPGPGDVIGKIVADFDEHGVDLDPQAVSAQLLYFERKARAEMLVTD